MLSALFRRESAPSKIATSSTITSGGSPGSSSQGLSASWEFDPLASPCAATPRANHKKMQGARRLQSVARCLAVDCPMTRAQSPRDHLSSLQASARSLSASLTTVAAAMACAPENPERPAFKEKLALQRQLGETLLEACRLNQACAGTFGFESETTFDMICQKVETRTPYISAWGDEGVTAANPEEALAIWESRKREENDSGGGESEDKEEESRIAGAKKIAGKAAKSIRDTAWRNWYMLREDKVIGIANTVGLVLGGVFLGYLIASRRSNSATFVIAAETAPTSAAAAAAAAAAVLPSFSALPDLFDGESAKAAATEAGSKAAEAVMVPLRGVGEVIQEWAKGFPLVLKGGGKKE